MEENKNNLPIDDERKTAIKSSMGCLLGIFIFMALMVVSLVFMYFRAVLTGAKEFMIN